MDVFFTKFIDMITSEYGVFTSFTIFLLFLEMAAIRLLWRRNELLSTQFLEVIKNNTEVMTKLVVEVDHLNDKQN